MVGQLQGLITLGRFDIQAQVITMSRFRAQPDGTMVSQPKKYIEKLKKTYVRLFNTEPSKGLKTPLEKNDHPELDTSEILEGQEVN